MNNLKLSDIYYYIKPCEIIIVINNNYTNVIFINKFNYLQFKNYNIDSISVIAKDTLFIKLLKNE